MAGSAAAAAMSPKMIFFEYLISLVFQLIALTIFSFLFYKTLKNCGIVLSPLMKMYIVCCIFQTICGCIYLSYLLIFWTPDIPSYNAYIFFITATFAVLMLLTNSLCVTFLSLERIVSILFPLKITSISKSRSTIGIGVFIGVFVVLVLVFDFVPDYPTEPITHCRAQTCLRVKSAAIVYTNVRYCIAAINVLTGILLGILIRKHFHGGVINVKANKVVFTIMISAFICDFLPHFSTLIRQLVSVSSVRTHVIWRFQIFALDVTTIAGPHSIFFGATDVFICSLLYGKTFLWKRTSAIEIPSVSASANVK